MGTIFSPLFCMHSGHKRLVTQSDIFIIIKLGIRKLGIVVYNFKLHQKSFFRGY